VKVGELKKFIEDNNVPDEADVWLEIDSISDTPPLHLGSDAILVSYKPFFLKLEG
jgi:hypothetical protein